MNPKKIKIRCDHEMNRGKVCFLCFKKKSNVVNLIEGGKIFARVQNCVKNSINFGDERIPKGICSSCRKLVLFVEQGKKTVEDLPELYDYNKIIIPTETRR